MSNKTNQEVEEDILDHARLVFQHFSPKEGDIVAITVPETMRLEQSIKLAEIIKKAVPPGVQAMMLLEGVTMQVMTEEEMNANGWMRIPTH